jgi:glycosyltransferase involved in cell wall biosynthesis
VYDIPCILEGVAPVLARHPHARLVVAGTGSLTPELERAAARRLPPGRWRFTGRLEAGALAELLGRAEVYLSASRSDSTSLSLLEAMAAGALPVVSDLEGNREWVSDGDGARLFPVGDAAALGRGVEAALADPGWAARARARNAAVIAERADRPVQMGRIEALFEDLVAARRRGAGR